MRGATTARFPINLNAVASTRLFSSDLRTNQQHRSMTPYDQGYQDAIRHIYQALEMAITQPLDEDKALGYLKTLKQERDESRAAYEAETLSTAEMAKQICKLARDKALLLEKGERLVRWVESNRHDHEEIRDHNGRLKDTGIWASFYTEVRGIQRRDTPKPAAGMKEKNASGEARPSPTPKPADL